MKLQVHWHHRAGREDGRPLTMREAVARQVEGPQESTPRERLAAARYGMLERQQSQHEELRNVVAHLLDTLHSRGVLSDHDVAAILPLMEPADCGEPVSMFQPTP